MSTSDIAFCGLQAPGGIYIHFPFCLDRCAYCSFVSSIYDGAQASGYFSLIKSEIEMYARLYGKNVPQCAQKRFDSIYIGGGTPSVAREEEWRIILDSLHSSFHILSDAEITMEVNPATFDQAKAQSWKRFGINRISLGAQSFIDSELKSMNRLHNGEDTINAVTQLKQAGFLNICMDLLVGYPEQSVESIRKSLHKMVSSDPEHVSVYMLEIKEGAAIESLCGRGLLQPLDEDLSADMYETVCDDLTRNGYEQYEISNFCRPGYRSVHNMKYWSDGFYLGIGQGAHGRQEELRYSNHVSFKKYKDSVVAGEFPWETRLELDPQTRMVEALLMGLRLNRGVDLIAMSDRYKIDVEEFVVARLESLIHAGLLEFHGSLMRFTDRGRLLSNVVFERFI